MGNTELKTYRCWCKYHTCAFIGTEDPAGCCKDCTADNWLWKYMQFDDHLFNLDCVPEEAEYISRDANGYIQVWTSMPTLYEGMGFYHTDSNFYLMKASTTLNVLFQYAHIDVPTMRLIRRPDNSSFYKNGTLLKAKTSENIYKIERKIKHLARLSKIAPTYFKNIGDVTLEEINRCYHIVEKAPLSKEQMIDLTGEVITKDDNEYYTVLAYKEGGIKVEGLSEVLTAEKLTCYEYRTREGKPCYNFKIKENMQ